MWGRVSDFIETTDIPDVELVLAPVFLTHPQITNANVLKGEFIRLMRQGPEGLPISDLSVELITDDM